MPEQPEAVARALERFRLGYGEWDVTDPQDVVTLLQQVRCERPADLEAVTAWVRKRQSEAQ